MKDLNELSSYGYGRKGGLSVHCSFDIQEKRELLDLTDEFFFDESNPLDRALLHDDNYMNTWDELQDREAARWVIIDLSKGWGINVYDETNIDYVIKELEFYQKEFPDFVKFGEVWGDPCVAVKIYTGTTDQYVSFNDELVTYPETTDLEGWLTDILHSLSNYPALDEDAASEIQADETADNIKDEIKGDLAPDKDIDSAVSDVLRWLSDNNVYGEYSEDSRYERYPDGAIQLALYKTGNYDPDEIDGRKVVYYRHESIMMYQCYYGAFPREWYWDHKIELDVWNSELGRYDYRDSFQIQRTAIYDADTDNPIHIMKGDYEYTDLSNYRYHGRFDDEYRDTALKSWIEDHNLFCLGEPKW